MIQYSVANGAGASKTVLLSQLLSQINVQGMGSDGDAFIWLQNPLPNGVTPAQVQQVINAWTPAQTMPATPQQTAISNIQTAIQNAGGWGSLTAAQKDTLLKMVVQHLLNQTL